MSKVVVTKAQMEAVRLIKTDGNYSFETLIGMLVKNGELNFAFERSPINDMGLERIVLAWHGYVNVEPNIVSFDEAMVASDEGKGINFHPEEGSKVPVTFKIALKLCSISDYSLKALREGKWSIED